MSKRKIHLPRLTGLLRRPRAGGRHSQPGRAHRTREPRYQGTHQGTPPPVVRPAVGRAAVVPRMRKAPPGRRVTALSDRPNTMVSSPRARFASSTPDQQVKARITYEKQQRGAQFASQRAGAKKRGPAAISGMGQPRTARAELAQRPHRGTQVHTYPEPYDRPKAGLPPAPAAGRARGRAGALPAHPARGRIARPPAQLPGDVTPTGRMGGSRAGGEKPHPFFARKG